MERKRNMFIYNDTEKYAGSHAICWRTWIIEEHRTSFSVLLNGRIGHKNGQTLCHFNSGT
jgi:hypothetical protein